jgi:hypothetical protein
MRFERPEYIEPAVWDGIVAKYKALLDAWEEFSPETDIRHYTLVLAEYAAKRASASAPRSHRHPVWRA